MCLMDEKMIDNLHISEQNTGETSEIKETSWEQFENDCMTDEERIAFLEQLLRDEESLDQLASLEMAPMPAYLESEILESILGEEQLENSVIQETVQPGIQRSIYRPPKWLQLFSYSVKITFAAACAIVALFRMPDMGVVNREQAAMEREQESLEREAEAAKRQQKILAQQEERRQKGNMNNSYIADALQFITEKIFVGGIENE